MAYLKSPLSLVKSNRARVDGGGNIDTLVLDGGGLTLDLTNISNIRIQDIEKIDITGSGDTQSAALASVLAPLWV
jgi:hypothetical protein